MRAKKNKEDVFYLQLLVSSVQLNHSSITVVTVNAVKIIIVNNYKN